MRQEISLIELIQELDDEEIENMYFTNNDRNVIEKEAMQVKDRIAKSIIRKKKIVFPGILVASIISLLLIIPATGYALSSQGRARIINEINRHLIGQESTASEGQVRILDGEQEEYITNDYLTINQVIQNNSIVNKILYDDCYPNSINSFSVLVNNDLYITPEIMMDNNSVAIWCMEQEKGWKLQRGDRIRYSFEKYSSNVVDKQLLGVGIIKDGEMEEASMFEESCGTYEYEIREAGVYYIYVWGLSSDSLSLKQGTIEVLFTEP